MTTIAYRSGIMAADSRAYAAGSLPIGSKCKIERFDDGTLIGVSSRDVGGGEAIRRWYNDGMPADPPYKMPEDFTILVAKRNGEIYMGVNMLMLSGPLMGEYFAIGSGAEYALAAMAMGKTAKQAVKLACQLDIWSAKPIYCLTHKTKRD